MKCDGCEAQISKPIPVLFRNGHLEVECPNCGFEIDITDRILYPRYRWANDGGTNDNYK